MTQEYRREGHGNGKWVLCGGTFEYPASFPGAQMCIKVPVTSGECSDLFCMCMVFPMGTS